MADFESAGRHPVMIEKTDNIDLDDGPIGLLDEIKLRDVIKSIGYPMRSGCEPE